MTFSDRSQKIQEKIENIKLRIKAHQKNIKLLNTIFSDRKNLNGEKCDLPLLQSMSIQEAEKNYQWTLKNLNEQILLLERDLAVLAEYGI